MTRGQSRPTVVLLRLTAAVATKRIQALAADSENIKWSNHALARMNEREIFDVDVIRILCTGSIVGDPEPADEGEWKCKFVKRIRGGRDAGVVIILLPSGKLLVKTVEWEDVA